MIEQTVSIERMEDAIDIFGSFDENIRLIEQELGVRVVGRDGQVKISGEEEPVDQAAKVIRGLLSLFARGEAIHEQNVRYLIQLVKSGNEDKIQNLAADVICITAKGQPIKPKTIGQKKYVQPVLHSPVTIGGPAGTGKTYLAVAAAVAAFRDKEVNRIILTRPAVEAGERLGFLPGDLQEQGGPLPAAPVRRPVRDAGRGDAIRSIWSGGTSRWRPWPICAAGRWMTASSSWTRPRTPAGSR